MIILYRYICINNINKAKCDVLNNFKVIIEKHMSFSRYLQTKICMYVGKMTTSTFFEQIFSRAMWVSCIA